MFIAGVMFAGIAWIQTVGVLLGYVTQNSIMAATASIMNGIVFFVDAAFYVLATIVVVYVFISHVDNYTLVHL